MRTNAKPGRGTTSGRRLLVALLAVGLGVTGVAGPVAAQSLASVTPAVLTFGNVEVGTQSAAQSVTISHAGTQMYLGSVGVTAPFVQTATTCPGIRGTPLTEGQTCTVSFAFAPTSPTIASTNVPIVVVVNGRSRVSLTVSLSGNGVVTPKPSLTVTPPVLDYGNVAVGSTADLAATVTNSGNVPLAPTPTPVSISGGQAGDYAVLANACGPLAPGASCAVTVRFTPGAEGARTSSLVAAYQYQPVATVAVLPPVPVGASARLTGNGTPRPKPALTLAPPTSDFGSRTVGTVSAPSTYTATNTGNAPGKVASVALGGAAAGDYALASNGCAGQTLAPKAACTVTVTFKPTAVGARAASLTVTLAEGPSAAAAITGTGTPVPAPVLVLEPAGNDFGPLLVGTRSATATFTARNTGNAPGTVASVALGGATPGDYALAGDACTKTTLAPAATCTIGVVFAPTATGARPATLGAALAEGPKASVLLAGTGTAPAIAVDPPTGDLGSTFVGHPTLPATFTVKSTGTASATLTGYLVDGAQASEFAITGGTCAVGLALAPGASCSMLVVATPAAPGPRTGRLLVGAGPLQAASQLRVVGIAAPVIRMVPPLGQAGRVTTVVGTDFPAGATVRLGWAGGRTVDVKADGSGGFRLDVLVLLHSVLGTRRMQAAAVDKPFPTATAAYLVTAVTVRPHGPTTTATAERLIFRG